MDEGVRELKQHLSEYLARAPRGIDEGWIRPALRRDLSAGRRYRSERKVLDVLAEDREE